MSLIRDLYRKIVPRRIRDIYWFVRNLCGHVTKDQLPQAWDFNYEKYWRQRGEGISYPEFVDFCIPRIPAHASVLDIGCGSGDFLAELTEVSSIKAMGVDISERAVEIARSRGINAQIKDVRKEDLSTLGSFDVVTVFELLEHIPDSEELLLNLHAWFPTAKFIVSVPNTGYLASRLRLLFGRFPKQWHIHPSEHLRFWTLHDFQMTLDALGYEVLDVISLRGVPVLRDVWPGLFGEVLVFELRA